ncbi:MAG: hypothetical protein KF734_01705 [Saprospiraceae bacterium]|nr:hypothetical protein [Saprospiraceae bacterium]
MKKLTRTITHILTNLLNFFSLRPALTDRIETALYDVEKEFERLKRHSKNQEEPWILAVQSILADAKLAQQNEQEKYFPTGQRELFWSYIHLIEQHLIWGQNDDSRLARAKSLLTEAKKIGGSRGQAILDILGSEAIEPPNPERLYRAVRLRDDHYNTKYHKINLRKSSLRTLAFLLAAIVIAGIAWMESLSTGQQRELLFWEEAVSGLFLGALGASFSMAYTLTASSLDMKIPDQIMGAMITFIRLAIGGTAAFITLLLFKSGLLDAFLSQNLLGSQYGFFIVAFIAGFSERWIVNVMNVLSKDSGAAKNG